MTTTRFVVPQRRALSAGRSQVWRTPPDVFAALDVEFHFTVDAAAHRENALCSRFWDEVTDGLAQDWTGERVWCNPPYDDIGAWTTKAAHGGAEVAVLLVPARVDSEWWHRDVIPHAEIRYVRGRLKFGGVATNAPFAVVLLVFRRLGGAA